MSPVAPLPLAILISGRGSNMLAIARACRNGQLAARVALVLSDRADAAGLAAAAELGIATATVPRGAAADAGEFESRLQLALAAHEPACIALAGFMRILSASFVSRYAGRMFNIHPSLLPAYRGLHTHPRVLAAAEREHGASVHFVTAELDGGPVVLQSKVAVVPGDTATSLAARVQATEHIIYPRVLGWFAARRLAWLDGGAWLDGQRLQAPLVEEFRAARVN